MSDSPLFWHWHRLRSMDLPELAGHLRKKCFQMSDGLRRPGWASVRLESSALFPKLPDKSAAPSVLREALKRDAENILAGHWKAFGHLELEVDDPPRWHTDYLAGKDLTTDQSAFGLDHRELPDGADIKLVWELSRWHQLARLAQAAWLLADERAARKCIRWLEDWVAHNPPYRGWNWTSALEAGMRLVQFTWMDAWLGAQAEAGGYSAELERLRRAILPPHVWFTWRYRSFGSSANNHLIGELAGLILATARWRALEKWGAALEPLQRLWEREVLAQFGEDGGNREQALNYHLFSWEFCWQTRLAFGAAGRKIRSDVEERLARAARFYWEAQAHREAWDYGDSDNAFVTPFFAGDATAVREWRDWIGRAAAGTSLEYWLGASPEFSQRPGVADPPHTISTQHWWIYNHTGIAVCELGFWWLRWDLSPLGYLAIAAHGHADAQHLSIWFKGVPMVVDPGTGAYYADKQLRAWLASRAAHNGPCPVGEEFPRRLGPFLWSKHHERPTWRLGAPDERESRGLSCELSAPGGQLRRTVTRVEHGDGWRVADEFQAAAGGQGEFAVRWQFAPGSFLKVLGERKFLVKRSDASVVVEVGGEWAEVGLVETQPDGKLTSPTASALAGVVSPAFRKTIWAPYLKLTARADGHKPCVFRTTFLASVPS